MDVSCPHCQAFLALPPTVVGQTVRCPRCQSVLHAEAGRLVAEAARTRLVAPPPDRADESPLDDDGDLDDDLPGQRATAAFANLHAATTWLRAAAVANVVAPVLLAVLSSLGRRGDLLVNNPHVLRDLATESLATALCGLTFLAIPCLLVWTASRRLQALHLHGSAPQLGLFSALFLSLIDGSFMLIALNHLLGRHGGAPLPALLAVLLTGGVAALTLYATVRATRARRLALALNLPRRLVDSAEAPSRRPRKPFGTGA